MKVIKKSGMEFTIHYTDGTEKQVKEGIMLEFEGKRIQGHIGTRCKEHIFASMEALEEFIVMAGYMEQYRKYRRIEEDRICGVNLTELEIALDQLQEYQDTGLTPEQIREMDTIYTEKCQELAAERKEHSWIPVEERLPENPDELVLVQVSGNSCENIRFENAIELARYNCEEGWIVEHYPEWSDVFPVAWMYLPEPYRQEHRVGSERADDWKEAVMRTFLGGSR